MRPATPGGRLLSGPARASVGAVRDYVLGVTLVNGRGELLTFGGQLALLVSEQLWVSDGTGAGTVRLHHAAAGPLADVLRPTPETP